ncbi:MAG: hypothetical protein ACRER2_19660 [Methylococcales bacterium]
MTGFYFSIKFIELFELFERFGDLGQEGEVDFMMLYFFNSKVQRHACLAFCSNWIHAPGWVLASDGMITGLAVIEEPGLRIGIA